MQDRQHAVGLHVVAHLLPGNCVIVSSGPAAAAGHDAHAVGTQRIEFAWGVVDADRLDIGITEEKQVAVERLEE